MKNKIIVDLCGVKCPIITDENQGYMSSLSSKVETIIKTMNTTSKDVALAVTALSLCDDLNISLAENKELKKQLEKMSEKIKILEKELADKNEVKKYSQNPLRFDPSGHEKLESFYEKIDE